ARVLALGVFPQHVVVDVAALAANERAGKPVEKTHRPEVDVEVEDATEDDEQAPHRDVIGHQRRIADGAEIYGVELPQDVRRILRDHATVRLVPVTAPGKLLELEVDAVLRAHRLEHAHAFGHHFPPDAVAGNHCNAVLAHGLPPFSRLADVDMI